MSDADAWKAFIEEITPYVSPNWLKYAVDHGDQSWVRLISLVDVQNILTAPQSGEKMAATMADLAVKLPDGGRGWQVRHAAWTERLHVVLHLSNTLSPDPLSPELHQLYLRSATPVPNMEM